MLALLCTSQEHYHRKGNSKYSTNGMDATTHWINLGDIP